MFSAKYATEISLWVKGASGGAMGQIAASQRLMESVENTYRNATIAGINVQDIVQEVVQTLAGRQEACPTESATALRQQNSGGSRDTINGINANTP